MNKKFIIIFLFTLLTAITTYSQTNKLRADEFIIDTNVVYVPAAGDQAAPCIATDDTTAFVVWYDRRNGTSFDIYGARVDEAGNILDPAGILIAHGSSYDPYPAVGFDGTNYLVVWGYAELSGQYDIYGMRVSKEGELIDAEPFVVSDATGSQTSPDVAFDGTNYLVVWHNREGSDPYHIYGMRVSKEGELLDSEQFVICEETGSQQYPAVAFDGTNYLVAWQDTRGGTYDIYGTRVSQDGTVLNSTGIAISTAADYQYFPNISFDGNNYMVVWQDQRDGVYDIYGSRVAQDGNVLDPAGIQISGATDEQNRPSIDFDGTNYLVVWDDYRSGSENDIYATFIDTSGNVLNPAGITISSAADNQYMPSVSFDGTNYLVAWYDRRDGANYDIYGTRVDQSGVVQDASGIAISNIDVTQVTPAVISYSGQWLTVWRDNRNGGYADIYGSRISASGTVTDPSGILIASAAQLQEKPAVAFDGTNYLVVWQEDRGGGPPFDLYGRLIAPTGNQVDVDAIPISTSAGSQQYPAVAFDNDSTYLVVWQDDRSGSGNDIYGTRVSTSGNVLDPPGIAISTATGRQQFPSIAFDGTNFLVVWADERGGSVSTDDIYGTLVEPDGSVLSPSGNVIADDDYWQDNPSVAFDGTNYLVVWDDYGSGTFEEDIYGVRVNQSGIPIDGSSIAISTADNGQYRPVVAFDGTNYLVVWYDRRNNNASDIYGTRVNQSGTVLDASGTPIIPYSGTQQYPFIVFDGTNYVVGCENYQDESPGNILGATVNTAGTPSGIFTISDFTIDQYVPNPSAASGSDGQILVVFPEWADSINGNPTNAMRIWGNLYPAAGVEENDDIVSENGRFDLNISPITQGICNISFVNSASEQVKLKIFNIAGILLDERIVGDRQGTYDLNIDMSNLVNGTYFISVSSENISEKQKMVLIK
jgi:hypothetical protein